MIATVLVAAALAFTKADADLAYRTAKGLVDGYTPRDAGTIRGRLAADYLLDSASAAGADVRRDVFTADSPKGKRTFVNLYAEFAKGRPEDGWVVLVSHYDTKPGTACPGANDGASTSGLLVGLVNAFTDWKDRKGNLLFIWTDAEECVRSYSEKDGFQGARRAVRHVLDRGLMIRAVICLDMIGDRDLAITVPANGTPSLAKLALVAAKRAGYPELVNRTLDLVKDDHVAFLEKGMPAIDLIDFSYGPDNTYWHTPKDTMEHVSVESLLKSGRIVAEMLNILL